jgi:hypothetical protein
VLCTDAKHSIRFVSAACTLGDAVTLMRELRCQQLAVFNAERRAFVGVVDPRCVLSHLVRRQRRAAVSRRKAALKLAGAASMRRRLGVSTFDKKNADKDDGGVSVAVDGAAAMNMSVGELLSLNLNVATAVAARDSSDTTSDASDDVAPMPQTSSVASVTIGTSVAGVIACIADGAGAVLVTTAAHIDKGDADDDVDEKDDDGADSVTDAIVDANVNVDDTTTTVTVSGSDADAGASVTTAASESAAIDGSVATGSGSDSGSGSGRGATTVVVVCSHGDLAGVVSPRSVAQHIALHRLPDVPRQRLQASLAQLGSCCD